MWGILIGTLENYRYVLNENAFIILISLFGLKVFGGIERDFVFAAANIIQFLMIVIIMSALISKKVN